MKRIAGLVGRDLKWTQPRAFKMEYELRVADELAAKLHFPSSFRCFATGESADGCWAFKRERKFSSRVTIRPCNGDAEVGAFKCSGTKNASHVTSCALSSQHGLWSNGGVLEFPGGRSFNTRGNIWTSRYAVEGASGELLITLKNHGCFHKSADVTIHREAANVTELPLLVLFSWYLDVRMQNDAAIAAAT